MAGGPGTSRKENTRKTCKGLIQNSAKKPTSEEKLKSGSPLLGI
jgi:hypothetical protein